MNEKKYLNSFFWKLFYNIIVVPTLWIVFHILGLFDKKAARGLRGRKGLFEELQKEINKLTADNKRIWFHSSSMGEFEQAKPIITELKKRYPQIQIIVSFFSPSGYEHSQKYKLADLITYIPFDSYQNARKFVNIVKPNVAVIIRYDAWPNHLWALKRSDIPTFIASATLQNQTVRKLPVIKQFHREFYNLVDYILTVSVNDKNVFESFRISHPIIEVIGDTRYDQVWQRSVDSKSRQILDPKIVANKKVLVIGSSWKDDENILLPAIFKIIANHPEFIAVLVPHEPTIETLERIENELNEDTSAIRFSNLSQYQDEKIILIDIVGILMPLYRYAHIAYVGGSFHNGIHNVLEPASYGIPIIFGHKYENSQEAIQLVEEKAAFTCRDENELYIQLESLLENETERIRCGEKVMSLVKKNVGATQRILSYIEKVL